MALYIKILRKLDHLLHPSKGEVVMLHRVTGHGSKLEHNCQFEITPEFLEEAIRSYQLKGYLFVSIDDVATMLKTKRFPSTPFVCFTLDDGYKDNLLEAAPVFRKYNVPFCVYVATSFVTRDVALWWFVLEDLVVENDQLALADGRVLSCLNMEEKNMVFSALHDEILDKSTPKEYFDSLFANYTYDWRQKADQLTLGKEDLLLLAADPLCTIGAHTVNHANLSQLSYQEKREEMAFGRTLLSSWARQKITHFSYPYGEYDEECTSIAEQMGFSSAVIADGGRVRLNSNLMTIPRVLLDRDCITK